jgi:hypothetical protein
VSYGKSGAILAGSLAVLAVMQHYLHAPGDVLSMTDPALALLLVLMFRINFAAAYNPGGISSDPLRAAGSGRE